MRHGTFLFFLRLLTKLTTQNRRSKKDNQSFFIVTILCFPEKSATTQVHDWVVHRLGGILGSVGHRVKIHNITPATGKERGDVEIRDYVVLQKPRDLTDCLPPPRTLILDFTLTYTRFGRSQLSSLGQLTHTRRTDGAPEPDGALRTVVRTKIHHYRQLYINLTEPIGFIPVGVDTADRIYEDFSRLLFLHAHREASALANEIPDSVARGIRTI